MRLPARTCVSELIEKPTRWAAVPLQRGPHLGYILPTAGRQTGSERHGAESLQISSPGWQTRPVFTVFLGGVRANVADEPGFQKAQLCLKVVLKLKLLLVLYPADAFCGATKQRETFHLPSNLYAARMEGGP